MDFLGHWHEYWPYPPSKWVTNESDDCMFKDLEEQKTFLDTLVHLSDTVEGQKLAERIQRIERDEKCTRTAIIWAGVLAVLSVVGLSYSAVLVPEFFQNRQGILITGLKVLGLASMISMSAFGVVLLWIRKSSRTLHRECRCFLLRTVQSKLSSDTSLHVVSALKVSQKLH